MENLICILNKLKELKEGFEGSFFIPEIWSLPGFKKFSQDEKRPGEIKVNPYEYSIFCIENIILNDNGGYSNMSSNGTSSSLNLSRNVIYSMLMRVFTAWDHYENREIIPGTFLKSICLLPYLKNLNVDIIYLLPVFKCSSSYKKGETGSPYAIKNIYKLDDKLHDALLGEHTENMLEIEFKAFIEACRKLGIKVMLDFVFRTVSRDNDMIVEHPEWFYWIDLKYKDSFEAPYIDNVKECTVVNDKNLKYIYKSKGLKEYLAQFSNPPRELDAVSWEGVISDYNATGENILSLIEKTFNITTVPGMSDALNDSQPPWTDVTYLKFYFDVNDNVKRYLPDTQLPFILHDTIKTDSYPGKLPNSELLEYIAGVIPYYQQKFGIDGARIDMGHALPNELNREIVARAKALNKEFIFWSEEFDIEKSGTAKESGFHFISGSTWDTYKYIEKPGFNKRLLKNLLNAQIPVAAAIETPDTPRAMYLHKTRRKIETLILLNCFIPNAVPFINNGMELMELQPMNLGIGNTAEGRYVLQRDDPMFGKLAFFDNYKLHWLNQHNWMKKILVDASKLRRQFIDLVSDKSSFICEDKYWGNKKITALIYSNEKTGKSLVVLLNRSFKEKAKVDFRAVLPEQITKRHDEILLNYSEGQICDTKWKFEKIKYLKPGEVIIGTFFIEVNL